MSVRAPINPKVLSWVIADSGIDRDELARVVGVGPDRLASWEAAADKPTLTQLRALAEKVKRPYIFFFLSELPPEHPKPPDLRTRGSVGRPYSAQLRLEIRRARYFQSLVAELDSLVAPKAFVPKATSSSDPFMVASETREWLGVTFEDQQNFRAIDRGFSEWRASLLERGVLTYVFRGEEGDSGPFPEALGFCLPHPTHPLVAVNGDGAPAERVFGLFHELGHIVVGQTGVSGASSPTGNFPSPLEQWCNRFANAFLLPPFALLELNIKRAARAEDNLNEFRKLATRYRVSRYVLLQRGRDEGWISREDFSAMRAYFLKVDRERRDRDEKRVLEKRERDKALGKSSGGPGPVETSLRKRGALLIARVTKRWSEGILSDDRAGDLLEIDPAQLGELMVKSHERLGSEK